MNGAAARPVDGGMRRAERAAPAASGLPCLDSNNYPKEPSPSGYKLYRKATYFRGSVGAAFQQTAYIVGDQDGREEGLDRDGRHWVKTEDGTTWEKLMGGLTSGEAKRAFSLRTNAHAFFNHYGRDVCAFLTFSPTRGSPAAEDPKELARRFNDARKHGGLGWMRSYLRVLEPRRDRSAHHHFGVATSFNLEPDKFDWESFRKCQEQAPRHGRPPGPDFQRLRRQYVSTAPAQLRRCWAELREVGKRFGLGRTEMLPIRTNAEAVSHYVGAYLEGGLCYRRDNWKGARRVEYDRTESPLWKEAGSAFGWVSTGARAWRLRVGELGAAVRAVDLAGLKRVFGRRWAYMWRPAIMCEPEQKWREMLMYVATEYGGDVVGKPMLFVGREVYVRWHSLAEWRETGVFSCGRDGVDWAAYEAKKPNGLAVVL